MDFRTAMTIAGWDKREFKGMPRITALQFVILRDMKVAMDAGWPSVFLTANPHTINLMLERGWIRKSVGIDGTRYLITWRGEDILRRASRPRRRRRTDGICPKCGKRPRETGKVYCRPCITDYGRIRQKAYRVRQSRQFEGIRSHA